jgi:hypothetical protein
MVLLVEDCGHMPLDTKSEVQGTLCVCVCVCVCMCSMSLNPVLVYDSTPYAEDVWGIDVKLHVVCY